MNHYPDPALAQSLIEHQDFVRKLAQRLTGNPAEADDVAQDTWVRALERRPSATMSLRPWLESSLRGLVRNRRRSASRRQFHERAAARADLAPADQLALRQEIVEAVLALEEPYRRTIVMAYEVGLTTREIAEEESVEPGTIRTRLHRAHRQLRERLGDDYDMRARIAALAAAPTGLRLGTLSPIPKPALGAAVWGPLAATLVVGLPVGAWMLIDKPDGGSSIETLARKTEPAPNPGNAPRAQELLASLAAPPQDPSNAARIAIEPAIPQDIPYWKAVRKARSSIVRYTIDESDASAALRKRLHIVRIPGPPLPPPATLSGVIRQLATLHDVPIRMASESEVAPPSPLVAEWLVAPDKMSLASWLDLVVALRNGTARDGRIQWEVQDGALEVAMLDSLIGKGRRFEFRLDDLCMDPTPYFENAQVAHPVFKMTPIVDDFATALVDDLGVFQSDELEVKALVTPPAILWRHTPRQMLLVQGHLDDVRGFRQPLPEHGSPGGRFRSHESAEDARVLAALTVAGGPRALLSQSRRPLDERLRDFGSRHRLGVLCTASARKQFNDPQQLAVEVLYGCLMVKHVEETTRMSRATLWLDLRNVLNGRAITPEEIAADPHLQTLASDGKKLELDDYLLSEYTRRFIAQDSWNRDQRNSLRITGENVLIIHQDPWVLDEIERLVEQLTTVQGRSQLRQSSPMSAPR